MSEVPFIDEDGRLLPVSHGEWLDFIADESGAIIVECPNADTALAFAEAIQESSAYDDVFEFTVKPITDDEHPEPMQYELLVEHVVYNSELGWFTSDVPEESYVSSVDVTEEVTNDA